MEPLDINHELYIYIRTILGMVLGLALARLLSGLAKFVQQTGTQRIYLIHIVWVMYLFLSIVTFWWWEVQLVRVESWTFPAYLFLIVYAGSFFFLCALLFPDTVGESDGYNGYLLRRRHWFFGILALNLMGDFIDTAIKGWDYFASLGPLYPVKNIVIAVLCLIAIRVAALPFHIAFAIAALGLEIAWTAYEYTRPYIG